MTHVNKWMLNRAGLLNFWYYDEEIFQFSNGKLLLRGNNGSGKSVTMQSFIPVLLDGKKSPDRLDPFGSKARRMEDYLLGEKDVVDRDERTGYLFIEYKRTKTDQYVTTGIGLQAKRHKNMDFWGFVIFDNRRIGYDFNLYKTERHGGETRKVPLSRVELVNRIADGGVVVRTQSEYMQLVNKHIFGFASQEHYEDLIKLLIQLRSPKLSKDFKPTVIYEILEAALPPLSDDDLRPLSDTIEHMDQTKQQLEQLEREDRALKKLTDAYHTYNQYMLAEKASEAVHARHKWEQAEGRYEQLKAKHAELSQTIERLKGGIQGLEQDREVAEQEQTRLYNHDVWNLEGERENLESQWRTLQRDVEKKERQLDEQRRRELKYRDEQERKESEQDEIERSIEEKLEDLAVHAADAGFDRHEMNVADYARREEGRVFDFSIWKQEANRHYDTLRHVLDLLQDYESVKDRYRELSKDYADVMKEIDQLRHEEQEWRNVFEEERGTLEDAIHRWAKTHAFLPLSDEAMQQALRALYGLYESHAYEDVRRPLFDEAQSYRERLHTDIAQKKHERNELERQIKEWEETLHVWRSMKDPEPDVHEATRQSREKLKAAGVAFLPFYAAVEFQEHVNDAQRERIESALKQMGLLDALIAENELKVIHDKVLQPAPNVMAHSLADYLQPDVDDASPISAERVDQVLRSVLIADEAVTDGISLDENGEYSHGLIKGHAPPEQKVRFIGRTARERYRRDKIREAEEAIASLQTEKAGVEGAIDALEATVANVRKALDCFPEDSDLHTSFEHIRQTQLAVEQKTRQREQMDERLKAVDREYKTLKRAVEKETADIPFPLTREAFHDALAAMRQYEKILSELGNEELRRANVVQHIEHLKELIEQQAEEVDGLKGELNELTDRKQRTGMHLDSVRKQIEQMGADDIRRQISEVQQRLESIKSELESKRRELPEAEVALEQTDNNLATLDRERDFWKKLSCSWLDAYKKEVSTGFVDVKPAEDAWDQAAAVKKTLAPFYAQHERAKVSEWLTKAFYSEQPSLMEYRLSEYEERVKQPEWMDRDDWKDEHKHMLERWKQLTSRNYIELDYQGQRVSPYFVKRAVEDEMTRNKEYLKEQDRELYEEIILNSVGNMLRSRIQRAERWVKEMNSLMLKRDNSSGLTFSIQWKPRTAEAEEELDTKDLVELLRMNPRLLKDSDLDSVTRHFRSKIDRAKALADESRVGHTLHQVLKDVLDYRKWFSFILHYKRENEPKRELTNNAFYKFSGGEKAMAMYIPLFAAAYSRYREADEAAPYIISLDEAFAGVDENNIRDMFKVLEELDFNYIMNSQALWGDYDTVSELSICELVRPKNADYVTVIHYYWDGRERQYVPQAEMDAAKREIAATQ